MRHGQRAELIDRMKGTLQQSERGEGFTSKERRILARDAEELARRLGSLRVRYPDLPAASLSPHLFRMLKEITGKKRCGEVRGPVRRAANF